MGKPCMIAKEFLLADEMHRRVVVREVVRHRHDRLLHRRPICALLEHNIALARMLLPRGERRICAAAYGIERRRNGHCILLGIPNARNAANRIRVPLTNAATPECIVRPIRENRVPVDPRE